MPRTVLSPQFTIEAEGISRVGSERIALLEAIRDHGSISAAARAIGLSYKAAWDGASALNNLFPVPLFVTQPGGRHGGGAELTTEGAEVIDAFHLLERELTSVMEALSQNLGQASAQRISILHRNLSMKTSARNALRCTVDTMTLGPVNAEIVLHLSDGVTLTVIITKRSANDLDLKPGRDVLALIKSSFVLLAPANEIKRISARNKLFGTVLAREDGAISTEYVLDIGRGKTIAAVVTKDSADELNLYPGDAACALIKASHVILAIE